MKKLFGAMEVTLFALTLAIGMCGCAQNQKNEESKEVTKAVFVETVVETPEQALQQLAEGNKRFVSETNVFPHHDHKRVEETAPEQHPFATVIGCSDSRVPVELIFDQGVGDIFVIRTAGNSVNDDMVMGSLDYSIDHLGVKLIVVLGHESCGGITGAIATCEGEGHEHHVGKVGELISSLREDVKDYVGKSDKLDEAIHANVHTQVARISEADHVKELIAQGKVKVVGAYYDVQSGEVAFIN